MAAGDKEILAAFEEVIRRNVTSVTAYTKNTRKIVRELEEKVKKQDEMIRLYDQKIAEMRKQIAVLQAKLYAGGS